VLAELVGGLAESVVAVADERWNGDESVDVIVNGEIGELAGGVLVVDATVIDALDSWRTVPAWGAELADDALPAESGIVAASVSFTKGCYTGQELTARMDSRNTIPPKVLTVIRDTQSADDEHWSPTSSVVCGDTTVQLGFVARSNLTDQQRVGSEPVPPLRLSLRS
jgi:folate-binding protein YgfZ